MRIHWVAVLLFLFVPVSLLAQTPCVNCRLAAEQPAADFAEANTIGWKLYVDGQPTLIAKTCVEPVTATGFTCTTVPLTLTLGQTYDVWLTANLLGAESGQTATLRLRAILVATPSGIRVVDLFGDGPAVAAFHRQGLVEWQWQHQAQAIGG